MEAVQVSNKTLGPVPLALLINSKDNEPDPVLINSTLNSYILPNASNVDELGTPVSQPYYLKGPKRTDNDNDRNNQNNKVIKKKFNLNDFMKQKIQDKLKSIPLSSTKIDDYQTDM